MGVYYVIRDGERLRTVHIIKDSAEASFNKLIKETDVKVLELVTVTTDLVGCVLKCTLVASWTRRTNILITHMTDITADYLMI
jgi:hypothetical protein